MFTHWAFGEQRTFDLRPELHAITSPTLVLAGTDDPITPASGARELVEALGPDVGSIEVFDDCGHGVWRDQTGARVRRDPPIPHPLSIRRGRETIGSRSAPGGGW